MFSHPSSEPRKSVWASKDEFIYDHRQKFIHTDPPTRLQSEFDRDSYIEKYFERVARQGEQGFTIPDPEGAEGIFEEVVTTMCAENPEHLITHTITWSQGGQPASHLDGRGAYIIDDWECIIWNYVAVLEDEECTMSDSDGFTSVPDSNPWFDEMVAEHGNEDPCEPEPYRAAEKRLLKKHNIKRCNVEIIESW